MTQLVKDDDGLFAIEQTIAELESQRQTILAARRADDLAKAKKLIEQHGFTSTELGLKDRQSESRTYPRAVVDSATISSHRLCIY